MSTTEISQQEAETEKKAEKVKLPVNKKTFAELFAQIKEKLEKADITALKDRIAYEFHLSDLEGVFYVEAHDGQIDVQPYDCHDHNGVIFASAATYEALCDGGLTPITAYAAGRLKVDGNVDQVKALMKIFA